MLKASTKGKEIRHQETLVSSRRKVTVESEAWKREAGGQSLLQASDTITRHPDDTLRHVSAPRAEALLQASGLDARSGWHHGLAKLMGDEWGLAGCVVVVWSTGDDAQCFHCTIHSLSQQSGAQAALAVVIDG